MRAIHAALWLCSLAAVFALARYGLPAPEATRLASVESFRSALSDNDELERAYRISAFLRGMSEEDLPEALAALESRRLWLSTDDLRLFMLAWTRLDPAGAFAQVASWPSPARDVARGAAIYAWAYRDPTAAQAALEAVENPFERQQLRQELVAGWSMRSDVSDLSDWIGALPDGEARQRFTGRYARQLLGRGADRLIAWANGVPLDANDDFKAEAVLKAANALAQHDIELARAFVEQHWDQPYSKRVPAVIVRYWPKEDARGGVEWSLGAPLADGRDRALILAFRAWMNEQPEESAEWIRERTPDPVLDSALRVLAQNAPPTAPQEGFVWAERIHDQKMREAAYRELAQRWKRIDPAGLEAWLAEAEVSDELRAQIEAAPSRARAAPSGQRPLAGRPPRRPRPGAGAGAGAGGAMPAPDSTP